MIPRNAGHSVGNNHMQSVHKVYVVAGGDGLNLACRAVGEAAVANTLPVGVLDAFAAERAHFGLNLTTAVFQLVVHRLL